QRSGIHARRSAITVLNSTFTNTAPDPNVPDIGIAVFSGSGSSSVSLNHVTLLSRLTFDHGDHVLGVSNSITRLCDFGSANVSITRNVGNRRSGVSQGVLPPNCLGLSHENL